MENPVENLWKTCGKSPRVRACARVACVRARTRARGSRVRVCACAPARGRTRIACACACARRFYKKHAGKNYPSRARACAGKDFFAYVWGRVSGRVREISRMCGGAFFFFASAGGRIHFFSRACGRVHFFSRVYIRNSVSAGIQEEFFKKRWGKN